MPELPFRLKKEHSLLRCYCLHTIHTIVECLVDYTFWTLTKAIFAVIGSKCDEATDCIDDKNSECRKDRCKCKTTCYYAAVKNRCVLKSTPPKKPGKHGDSCKKDADCDGKYSCRDSDMDGARDKCMCPPGTKYIKASNKCKKGTFSTTL